MGEKQRYGYFKRQTSNLSHKKKIHVLVSGNLKREKESLPIEPQVNATRTNYIKVKIDKTQQNSK